MGILPQVAFDDFDIHSYWDMFWRQQQMLVNSLFENSNLGVKRPMYLDILDALDNKII